ncbi:MAG: hypothetical protein QOI31_2407 [Solirubrobacterales bacterium]|nr:hypothetical protein [Solirubrobacterales bacterium]
MRGGLRGVLSAGAVALACAGCAALFASEASAALTCDDKPVTIRGSNGDDVIKGTKKKDVIAGRNGADTIKGLKGNDTACGGEGADRLLGGKGDDRLLDDSVEADTLTGGPGLDVCTPAVEDTVDCDFSTEDPLVFVPFNKSPSPGTFDVAASTEIPMVDVYAILDRSGSMTTELAAIKNNFATVVNSLQCDPVGSGEPGECISDLWAGAGTVGYVGGGATAFQNFVDVQPNPSFAGLPTTEPAGCCSEPLTYAVHATATGSGGASFGVSVPARTTCTGSPAQMTGYQTFGYPCFRTGALPVIVLATDEAPINPASDTLKSPAWSSTVKPAMNSAGARFVGLLGDSAGAGTETDLETMATNTGAVDATNGNAPLVFDAGGSNAAAVLGDGIRALVNGIPLEVGAEARDDPSDSVDAALAFIDHIEVLSSGSVECPDGFAETDTNGDLFPDLYNDVPPGTPLCWRVVARQNQTVPATTDPQAFKVTVEIISDERLLVDEQEIYFVVPGAN